MTHDPDFTRRGVTIGLGAAAVMAAAESRAADAMPWSLPPLKTVKVNGHDIAYYEAGSGPPLVLTHGLSGSAGLEWGRVIGPLSRRFRVLAPYQIGFGPSAQPDLAYDAATFVDYLGGFMSAMGVTRPILAGESFGGWVVAHYARAQYAQGPAARTSWGAERPRIAWLVIIGGAVGRLPTDPITPDAPSINDPGLLAEALAFKATLPAADNARVVAKVNAALAASDVQGRELARPDLPVLLVWGDADKLIPPVVGRRLAEQIPGSRLVVVPDCGHIPSIERPAAFINVINGLA
jgi:2-hydroxy-6-oxonona-2,4-dienedioate hydrolase